MPRFNWIRTTCRVCTVNIRWLMGSYSFNWYSFNNIDNILIFSKKFVLDSFYFNLTWFSFFNIFAEYRYNRIFIYLLFD